MSISGPESQAINLMTTKLPNSGLIVVVAAGNDSKDACGYSPASCREAITVGTL
jgi:cerevisin